jgi:hypothetical protein
VSPQNPADPLFSTISTTTTGLNWIEGLPKRLIPKIVSPVQPNLDGTYTVRQPALLHDNISGSEFCPWLCSHDLQHQKHEWHCDSLQISSRTVSNEWGFSSTGVSRASTPELLADVVGEVSKAEEADRRGASSSN